MINQFKQVNNRQDNLLFLNIFDIINTIDMEVITC